MLPMSGVGAPMAGAPGDAGAAAGCLGLPEPVAPAAAPADPALGPAAAAAGDARGAGDPGDECAAGCLEPAFAGALPELPWPAEFADGGGCCPAAASANRQRI